MADHEDYLAALDTLNQIDTERVHRPEIPVEIVAKEAEMLLAWVPKDQALFETVNFDWSMVVSLPLRIGALRYAEAVWCNRRIAQKDAQTEFLDLRVETEDLKDEILGAMDFAFYNNDNLIKGIQQIREGSSNADLVLDLTTIYELGTQNRALLEGINFDCTKLDQIAEMGARLGELLAMADVEKLTECAERIVRDRAFTWLDEAIEKIRRCGKHVTRNDESRFKGYLGQYSRMLNRRYRRQKAKRLEAITQ